PRLSTPPLHDALPIWGQVARVAVAIDDQEVRRAVWDFATVLVPFLLVIGGLLVLAAWIQVRIGLGPLEGIQTRLTAIRQGRSPRERKSTRLNCSHVKI